MTFKSSNISWKSGQRKISVVLSNLSSDRQTDRQTDGQTQFLKPQSAKNWPERNLVTFNELSVEKYNSNVKIDINSKISILKLKTPKWPLNDPKSAKKLIGEKFR